MIMQKRMESTPSVFAMCWQHLHIIRCKGDFKLNNAQTFSQSSDQYAKSRPQYPAALFAYLSELCKTRDRAWDCATGNGQAAVSLAKHFSLVEATDISAEQIKHGILHPQVRYNVSPAEHTSFADASFDLIAAAQAVHWFEQDQFQREVERVLKSSGVLAIWAYGFFEIEPAIDSLIQTKLLDPIDPFWATGNRAVMNGYRDLQLPFKELNTPGFSIQAEWTLEQLSNYLRTWSAVKRFITDVGYDPVSKLESTLMPLWGAPESIKVVTMPLHLRVCRKP
jgi:SAM-dependent methyltransferase